MADPIRVLLVEDNPGDIRLVQEMVRDHPDFIVEVADRLSTGRERLEHGGIDIVLLDLGLVDSQGIGTLSAIVSTNSSLPVVTLTGLDDDSVALQSIQAGGEDYLIKGTVTSELLRRTIHQAIERKRMNVELRDALRQKEALLRELHHRVKNNLMVVSGLIHLQIENLGDHAAVALLRTVDSRLHSIALVYERIIKSGDFGRIDLQDYARALAGNICCQFQFPLRISFKIQVGDIKIGLDAAVPIGIILNELISNACKHAFPDGWKAPNGEMPTIKISASSDEDSFRITVADNGVGIPKDILVEKPTTMGIMLVRLLCDQVKFKIELLREMGTAFQMICNQSRCSENGGTGILDPLRN